MGVERKNKTLEVLEVDLSPYFMSAQAFFEKYGLSHLLDKPIDHIAFKARDFDNYSGLVRNMQKFRWEIYETELSGRKIAVARTPFSISTGREAISLVEWMEPKKGKSGNGLESPDHAEFVVEDLTELEGVFLAKDVKHTWGGNDYHKYLVVVVNSLGQEVKFTDRGLLLVIEQQAKEGKTIRIS